MYQRLNIFYRNIKYNAILCLFEFVIRTGFDSVQVSVRMQMDCNTTAGYRIKRRNGEHIQDTTLRPEMKSATQGHPMVFNER